MRKSTAEMQAEFRALEFGMFIHYNMATYHDVQWVEGYPSPATFDPGGRVDTDAWADAALSAGMRYAVLTTKHVGGFCLWDSQYTNYSVMHPDCPYQEDLVAQFIESFTRRGLKVGLYYCWRSPGFDAKYKVLPPECDPVENDLAAQIDFQQKQIAELVERYPQAFYIWNDGLDDLIMPADQANTFFRGLPRDVLAAANWWDWGKKGTPFLDIAIKEDRDFPEGHSFPGETCWALEDSWFGGKGLRPVEKIIGHMKTAFSRNSNFLLNVGPDRQGRISEDSLRALNEIGKQRNVI